MPLELLTPPALVQVRDVDGELRPALLLGRRDGRSYVQVSRGAGDNVLRWLPSTSVGPAGDLEPLATRVPDAPVQLRQPRSWR
jgi:hypothetical protein